MSFYTHPQYTSNVSNDFGIGGNGSRGQFIHDRSPRITLFSLPRELRDEVYELCIPDQPVIEMIRGKHPQWLVTSKQIFFEAAPMVYDRLCFYKFIDYENNPNLLDQLFMNYSASMMTCTSRSTQQTFEHVKGMISYIAIDVHLQMAVHQLEWLSQHYFDGLAGLANLKAFYISLNPRPRPHHKPFRYHLTKIDVRMIRAHLFSRPVELLLERAPSCCQIYWSIPEHIRRTANGGELHLCNEKNFDDIAEFMQEVTQAALAKDPQESTATEEVLTEVDSAVH